MPSNTTLSPVEEERRRFFRVDDSVRLQYQVVAAEQLPERLAARDNAEADSFSVMPNLSAVTQKMAACLHKIEQRNPEVANYLKALDQKVEMLGSAFLAKESGIGDQPIRPVNLSAGGMAVYDSQAFEVGETLEIRMLLLPSYTGILTYGQVVACDPIEGESEYPYCIRINFTHLRDIDQEALIRHLLRRQGEQLRKRREEREG